jgi:hypothetical protein
MVDETVDGDKEQAMVKRDERSTPQARHCCSLIRLAGLN